LNADSLKTSHPVQISIYKAANVQEAFDEISYFKGCSILRMIYEFIGQEAFFNSCIEYFNKYKYQNTEKYQFIDELSNSFNKDISDDVNTWLDQMG